MLKLNNTFIFKEKNIALIVHAQYGLFSAKADGKPYFTYSVNSRSNTPDRQWLEAIKITE
ncbi:hypothetical protein GCM10027443_08100 [Pontibacter brevis]